MLLRTHGFQAYQAAQYNVMDRQRDVMPFWQYLTMGDDHVRDSHAALNDVILPADHSFWQSHYPPWDFGCRCQVVALSESDMEDAKAADAGKPPEERDVIEGAQLRKLEENGTLFRSLNGAPAQGYDVRSPVDRATTEEDRRAAYQWKPGTMTMNADMLKARYSDPETGKPTEAWTAFEKFAKAQKLDDGRTVMEWMEGKEARGGEQGAGSRLAESQSSKLKAPGAESLVSGRKAEFGDTTAQPKKVAVENMRSGKRPGQEWPAPVPVVIARSHVVEKRLANEEAELRRAGVERAVVVTPSGKSIGPRDADAKGDIHWPEEDRKAMKDGVYTHLHPEGSSFSHKDVTFAMANDLAEMRALAGRWEYVLQRPEEGWPGKGDYWKKTVHPVFKQAWADTIREQADRIGRGEIKSMDASRDVMHEVWQKVAGKLGWRYARMEAR